MGAKSNYQLCVMDVNRERSPHQATVSQLLERIEENQKIQQHYHEFEFRVLACTALEQLLEELLVVSKQHFELDAISLVLFDIDHSFRKLLEHLELGDFNRCLRLCHDEGDFQRLFPQPASRCDQRSLSAQRLQVTLAPLTGLTVSQLFPGYNQLGSVASLPLQRQNRLLGCFHMASVRRDRFTPDKAADFMFHLALIVGLCLENCISREYLRQQGEIDMLTQVSNRRNFEAEFDKELERAQRSRSPLSCMFVDIDYFKSINDRYGHQSGDQCLKQVAREVHQQLRKTDLLVRYGGEEFVTLLPNCRAEQARTIAERVRQAIERMEVVTVDSACGNKQKITLTVSVGTATWEPPDERVVNLKDLGGRLLACADKAMYEAKRSGRNRVCNTVFASV